MKFGRAGVLFLIIAAAFPLTSFAQSASDLQNQIDAHNAQITALQDEIAQYQAQLDTLAKQKNTLQRTINSLTLSQKQLAAQIQVTQNKISTANLQLEQLGTQISDKESTIASDQAAIARALRDLAESEQLPVLAQLLSEGSLPEIWQGAEEIVQFNRALDNDVHDLQSAKEALSQNRNAVAATKAELVSYNSDLTLQKKSVDANKATEQTLLAQTNNQESSYQKLIAQKQASERSFEQELNALESQLHLTVNPDSLPPVGSGVLSWPFSLAYMHQCALRVSFFGNQFCITQYFGNTPYSTQNPQIYNGMGHDGLDIAAPIGTPVLAALSGTVLATGNTDLVRGCYSFGKWVMIEHDDGINTMYAHLSEVDVTQGQTLSAGDLVGLSGMTGYATGPHLHFGVYATEGTEIMTLAQFRGATTGCAQATMPVATKDAYLNPLSYL